ncbi:hypothetical protein B6D52_03400 [Candidatus Parcubacteria bacterium 4484_255]|nr:MAG: hypothetical protein B6D52_03400 [Candidatus Parcubacteria bacterium 4484_255]
MKVKKLLEFMKENTKFIPSWKELKGGGLSNPHFGSVERVVVCEDDGTPIFDQYQVVDEKGGAIIVPYYFKDNNPKNIFIGLNTCVRAVVADLKTGEQGNLKSIEIPRGFGVGNEEDSSAAIRELGEETQNVVKKLELIGYANANTAYFKNYGISTFAALVDPDSLGKFTPDPNEKILSCNFYSVEEIKKMLNNNKIFCALTKSALLDFFVFIKSNSVI